MITYVAQFYHRLKVRLQEYFRLIMLELPTCCRDPAVVVHAMPAFDVSGEWSGAVEESTGNGKERLQSQIRRREGGRDGERREGHTKA